MLGGYVCCQQSECGNESSPDRVEVYWHASAGVDLDYDLKKKGEKNDDLKDV